MFKAFQIDYPAGYCDVACDVVGDEKITENYGWTPDDISAIDGLEIGCSHTAYDMNAAIVVTRTA